MSPATLTDTAGRHTRQASLLIHRGSAGKGCYRDTRRSRQCSDPVWRLVGNVLSAHAYFNIKMSQCSSGLSRPNSFLTSSSAPQHQAVPREEHNLERDRDRHLRLDGPVAWQDGANIRGDGVIPGQESSASNNMPSSSSLL